MVSLSLALLGSPQLERERIALPLRRRKAIALFAYLAVTRKRHSRETLAALLWPEFEPSSARTNLRRDLSWLNKQLGKGVLVASRAEVGIDPTAVFTLDTAIFENKLAHVRQHNHAFSKLCANCAQTLGEAVALYGGDFMAGFTLPDTAAFSDWQFFQTESLRQELAWALQQLIGWQQAQGAYEAAVENGRLWVNLDPLHEPAQRTLMTLYAQAGQPAAALRQYETCVQLLADELGVEPEDETAVLSQTIRARQLPVLDRNEDSTVPKATTDASAKTVAHNLPTQSTPFLGRQQEISALTSYLADPDKRLITILGVGGMGKTRLALAVAEQFLQEQPRRDAPPARLYNPQFANGIFFVSLAPLSDVDQIVPTLAEALDFPLETGGEQRRPAKQQVLDYLRQKSMLLIFDNCEHLLDGVDLVADILQTAVHVKIIATSRERLQLHQEQLFTLHGLDAPPSEQQEDLEAFTAVQLFLQSARRVRHDFQFSAGDERWLVRLCHLVGGMPLAVELAASWVEMLSLADIVAEIQQSLDFLETAVRNIPARQRSIRAVFDGSWKQLRPKEQQILPQFAVFRGGFTRQAAQTITGASLHSLSKLVNKSLLQYDAARQRYQIHELLRQYLAGGWLRTEQGKRLFVPPTTTTTLMHSLNAKKSLKGRSSKQHWPRLKPTLRMYA